MSKRAFKKYFEWIGDTIYIRVNGQNTTTRLDELLTWFHDNRHDLEPTDQVEHLKDELHALWDKHNRLLTYLELEDVTMPQTKTIRKIKKRVVRVAAKPKKQAKVRKVSP